MADEFEFITIKGVVRSLKNGDATIEVKQGGCGRCHEEGGCGGQQLTQMFCSGPKTYTVANTICASVGDEVDVAIRAGSIRKTANLAYGVPLIAVICGAVLGASLGHDFGAIIGSGLGLIFSYAYIRIKIRDTHGAFSQRPHLVPRN